MSALRETMTVAYRTPPPLGETRHGGIMQCHLGVQPPNVPASSTQANAQFRLLAREDILTITADGRERVRAHHYIASTRPRLAQRSFPLSVPHPIIDRSVGVSLTPPSAYGDDMRMCVEE
jgi:hypothetical protein